MPYLTYLTILAHSHWVYDLPQDEIPLSFKIYAAFASTALLYPVDPINDLTIQMLRIRGVPIMRANIDFQSQLL